MMNLHASRFVPWYRKLNPLWALFGNEDDGLCPPWFGGDKPRWLRIVLWWLRNPFHNLAFYVFGVADRERTLTGKYGTEVHQPGGGWLWCTTRAEQLKADPLAGLSLLVIGLLPAHLGWSLTLCVSPSALLYWISMGAPLPFVSYLGRRAKFYFGWRPAGAFGIKFNFLKRTQ